MNRFPDYIDEFQLSIYINRGKEYPMYIVTDIGLKMIVDNMRTYENKEKLYQYCHENVVVLKDRDEKIFFDKLEQALLPFDIKGIRQYHILNYYIDYYISELNISIEYDEIHHNYKKNQDKQRKNSIYKVLGCDFIRVSIQDSDYYNIGFVINSIIKIKGKELLS